MEVLIPIAQGFALMNPRASGQLRFPEEEPQTQKHRSFHPRFHAWNTLVLGIQMSPLLEWQLGVSICLEATLQAQNLWSAEEKKTVVWTKNCQKNQRSFEKKIARSGNLFFLHLWFIIWPKKDVWGLYVTMYYSVLTTFMEIMQTPCYTNGNLVSDWPLKWSACFAWSLSKKLEHSKKSQIKQCCFCDIQERGGDLLHHAMRTINFHSGRSWISGRIHFRSSSQLSLQY